VRVILTGQYLVKGSVGIGETSPIRIFFRCWGKKIFLVLHGSRKIPVSSQNIFIPRNILDSDNIFTLSPRPQNLDQKKRPYRSTSKKT